MREAASRARHLGRPVLASWTCSASVEAISFFARAAGAPDRALWLRPRSGEALVGVGAARVLTGRGEGRFRQVAAAWRDLVADAVVDGAGSGPLLLGGFSFDPVNTQPTGLWSGFPDARMVLPERMLEVRDGGAWLTTNVIVAPDADLDRQALSVPEARQTPGALSSARPSPAGWQALSVPEASQTPGVPGSGMLPPAAWQALVGSVARGIRDGDLGLEKVVLARAERFEQGRPIDPQQALRTLAAGYPSCTLFAIAHGDRCFLGATPERLIALRDGTASTVALAGSFPRGATPAEDRRLAEQLRRDPKERAEHAIVVGALRDALGQVCSRVIADTEPQIKQLPNLHHLFTRVRGQVAAGVGVLDLVERLHPTPAVGGYPRQPALQLIREREALDRGWYAGPIGWLNGVGEGEFVVGIRSALVDGNSATLFAGCGIVADSNPATEYAESGWKLRPMRAALGVDG